MKKPNRVTNIRKILAIVMIFITFLQHGIFAYYFEKDGRPVRRDINLYFVDEEKIRYGIASMSLYDERINIYKLSGWAFQKVNIEESTDLYNTEIVLFTERHNFVFGTIPKERVDIITAFEAYNISKAGFDGLINSKIIPAGKYCIGLMISHNVKDTSILINTNLVLEKKILRLSITGQDVNLCESIVLNNYFKKNCYFD